MTQQSPSPLVLRARFLDTVEFVEEDYRHGNNLTFTEDGSLENHLAAATMVLEAYARGGCIVEHNGNRFRKAVLKQSAAHMFNPDYAEGSTDIRSAVQNLNVFGGTSFHSREIRNYGFSWGAFANSFLPVIDEVSRPTIVVDDDSFAVRVEQGVRVLDFFGAAIQDIKENGLMSSGAAPRPYMLVREGILKATQISTLHALFRHINSMEDVTELSSTRHRKVIDRLVQEDSPEDLDGVLLLSLRRVFELEANGGNSTAANTERLVRSFSARRRFTGSGVIKAANIATDHFNLEFGGFQTETRQGIVRERAQTLPIIRRCLPEAAMRILQIATSSTSVLSEQIQTLNTFAFRHYAERLVGVSDQKLLNNET